MRSRRRRSRSSSWYTGYPPFFDDNPFMIYEKILAGKLDWPQHMEATPRWWGGKRSRRRSRSGNKNRVDPGAGDAGCSV